MRNEKNMTLSPAIMKEKSGANIKKKTELCRSFLNGRECKFGLKCSFAHGEHERQAKLFADIDCVNTLEDAAHYGGYLCFDYVSTGSW